MDQGEARPALDLTRPPTGLKTAGALVRAVAASDDRIERHYLEVKSDLKLDDREHLAKIAKFILGAANRLPVTARTAFGGYAVFIAGVAPGEIRGVAPVEKLDLDKQIDKYLGAEGPSWDIIRVPVDDSENEVLVFVVDPPQDGQDPFVCQKEGHGLYNGRIYVRADGETRDARAGELELLLKRGKPAPDISAAFEVEIVGEVHPVEIDESATIESYIARTTTHLLRALPQDRPASNASGLRAFADIEISTANAMRDVMGQITAASSLFEKVPEVRTVDEYRQAIEQWEAEVRGAWPASIDELAGVRLPSVAVRVTNIDETYLEGVELKIHLDGDVRGIAWLYPEEVTSSVRLGLPSPPRRWGPTTRSVFGDITPMDSSMYLGPPNMVTSPRSSLRWENTGSVSLTLPIGELRPRETHFADDGNLILILPEQTDSAVSGTWGITVRGHHRIYSGNLSVAVGGRLVLTEEVRGLLELE